MLQNTSLDSLFSVNYPIVPHFQKIDDVLSTSKAAIKKRYQSKSFLRLSSTCIERANASFSLKKISAHGRIPNVENN